MLVKIHRSISHTLWYIDPVQRDRVEECRIERPPRSGGQTFTTIQWYNVGAMRIYARHKRRSHWNLSCQLWAKSHG